MTIQPQKTVSEATAKEYLNGLAAPITRGEYLDCLKDANDEGRVMRALEAAIETKEQWSANEHWAGFSKELREEFYIAYRTGYVNYKGE